MKILIKRAVKLFSGLCLMAFSTALAYSANLGMSPWAVLNHGISKTFPIFTIGQADITIGLIILSVVLLFKEKIGFGTVINILVVGNALDLFLWLGFIPTYTGFSGYEHIIPRLLMCIISVPLFSLSMYLYMSVGMGAGPRDSLMVTLSKRSKLSAGTNRLIIESIVFTIGFILGGKAGVGTVIVVLTSGPVMDVIFKLLKFDVKTIKNETFIDTIRFFSKGKKASSVSGKR